MTKKIFTVCIILSLIGIVVLKIYQLQQKPADWYVEYKEFTVNKKSTLVHSVYPVGNTFIPQLSTDYYITLEDEFGFGSSMRVSYKMYDSIVEGSSTTGTLLNREDGESSEYALIPYYVDLADYSNEDLQELYDYYPHVEW